MVEVVLPEELLGFLKVGGEAHVAGQTVAVDFDVAAVGALQGNTALAAVDDLELRQLALVAGVGVVEQTVLQGDGRAARRLVDDADGLAVGDVCAAVGAGLVDGEVVELGIAALLTFYIKGKERVAGALEGDELVGEGHHATDGLERHAVGGVGVLGLVVVVVADHAEVDFPVKYDGHLTDIV